MRRSRCCQRFCLFVGTNPKKIIYILYTILFFYGIFILMLTMIDKVIDEDTSEEIFWIGIAVSLVSIVNAGLGIYGTVIDEKLLVLASNVLLFSTCVIQIVVIFSRITLPKKDANELKKELTDLFAQEDEYEFQKFREIEVDHGCCGVMSHDDYEQKFEPLLLGYPAVCCEEATEKCTQPTAEGCYPTLMSVNFRNDMIQATAYLSSSAFKFVSSICIAILTFWGDVLLEQEDTELPS